MTKQDVGHAALRPEDLSEYDSAAEWCAKRGYKGVAGDPLPQHISSRVAFEIYNHPDEFEAHVRSTAYALAMGA